MRLDKYLANATALTRSQARKAIRQGRVLVDGLLQNMNGQKELPLTMPEAMKFGMLQF